MELVDKGLLVSPEKPKFAKININFSDEQEWYINRILIHLYTYGFEEIKAKYTNRRQLALIRKALQDLPGFEIIKSNPDYCLIKSVTSIDSADFEDNVRRTPWQILSQFNYFIDDAEKNLLKIMRKI